MRRTRVSESFSKTVDIIWTVNLDKFCVIRTNQMLLVFKFFPVNPLHVSTRLTIHPQEAVYCRCSLWQRGCTINGIDCTYNKLPAEDEQLTSSKHVEDLLE